MSRHVRIRLVLLAVALTTAAVVWGATAVVRENAGREAQRTETAQRMLAAMLQLEAGASTFLLSGNPDDAHLIGEGQAQLDAATTLARRHAAGEPEATRAINTMIELEQEWLGHAKAQISRSRRGSAVEPSVIEVRHLLVHAFREANATLRSEITANETSARGRLTWVLVAFSLLVTFLVAGVGLVLMRRREREDERRDDTENRYRDTQAEFAETMQLVQTEAEAHALLRRHLGRSLTGSRAVVLRINNSESRLETTTELPDGELAERLVDAEPRSCVATRVNRVHERGPGRERLMECELCGPVADSTLCSPLTAGGDVIGAVLVSGDTVREERARRCVAESISQAAPVLGNLRTLAIAENHAATDSLTGLPNRRSLQDTLKRMVAHAGRSLEPLAAIALDLDHFKQINDRYGHDKGDEVLAAVGALLDEGLRASDFASRAGGEEFCVLLPSTDLAGALEIAEKLRAAIARVEVPGVEREVSASFGVATYPEHAIDALTLMRKADRALYAAKEAGRNRVGAAAGPSVPEPA
jgi:diguanylate cyclase (GGDEF)-like protein